MFKYVILSALISLSLNSVSYAQNTPNDAFQVVERIYDQIGVFSETEVGNLQSLSGASDIAPRRPRHVYQKARQVLLKVQTVRLLFNLPQSPVPQIPAREITPSNVKELLTVIYNDISDLRPSFGIGDEVTMPEFPSSKTPTDVYWGLNQVDKRVEALGIPASVPNDVYRVVLAVHNEMIQINRQRGRNDNISFNSVSEGKTPGDAYEAGFALYTEIAGLVDSSAAISVPGNIVLLAKDTGKITPPIVLNLLNNLLADLNAIKVSLGNTTEVDFPPVQSGVTPSKVYDGIVAAQQFVNKLR